MKLTFNEDEKKSLLFLLRYLIQRVKEEEVLDLAKRCFNKFRGEAAYVNLKPAERQFLHALADMTLEQTKKFKSDIETETKNNETLKKACTTLLLKLEVKDEETDGKA